MYSRSNMASQYTPAGNAANIPNSIQAPMQVSCIEPYVVSALMTLIGQRIVVETTRGSMHGALIDVKPDHIVLGEMYGNSRFFIRIAEIVHIMPDINGQSNQQYNY